MDIERLYALYLLHPEVTTDSRHCPRGSIFFALRGDTFDGNAFAMNALQQGCVAAVVDDEKCAALDARCILVDNVLATLQALAHHHREQLTDKMVLQITGTNGKTTTKELIATVLSTIAPVQYTQGNLNNHIGVPLTLLTLKDDGGFAIVETGANHSGEIATLSRIVDPDMGIITNVGRAHLEGFGSFDGVMKAKGELYDYIRENDKIGIFLNVSADHLTDMAHDMKAVCYGLTGTETCLECNRASDHTPPRRVAEVWGEVVECNPFVKFRYRQADVDWQVVQTHLIGEYNIHNLMTAVAVGMQFGVPFPLMNKALSEYVPTNNRSEYHDTGRNHIIVDAYNANPSSMAVALDNFQRMKGDHKMVILGDMRELGADSEKEHRRVVERLQDFETVWLVGEEFRKVALPGMRCWPSVEEAKSAAGDVAGHTILIKGSNATRLSQLAEFL